MIALFVKAIVVEDYLSMAERAVTHDDLLELCNHRINTLALDPEVDELSGDPSRKARTRFRNIYQIEKTLKNTSKQHAEATLAAVRHVVDQLAEHIEKSKDFKYRGTFVPVGTSLNGTRPELLKDVDYLFEIKPKDVELFQSRTSVTDYKVFDEDEISARHINECIRNTIDSLFMEGTIRLPPALMHAGFASPRYSGVRRHGPATTLLFKWNESLMSINITVGLALPPEKEAEILQQVEMKLIPIRKDNNETPFDLTGKILLVPQFPDEKLWELNTSKLEDNLLQILHESAPVKRMFKLHNLIIDEFQRSGQPTGSGANIPEDEPTKELLNALDFYKNSSLSGMEEESLRRDVMKAMRYAHIFLPMPDAIQYQELAKPVMEIRSHAIKQLTLAKGANIPGAFSPTGSKENMGMLIAAVFDEIGHGDCHNVDHFFVGSSASIWTWGAYGTTSRTHYAATARDQCRIIVERFQLNTRQKTPFNQRNDVDEPEEEPQELALRGYQQDLAARAISGNTIVLAPERCGKGHVAVKLAEVILNGSTRLKKNKICHICAMTEGVSERWRLYKRYLSSYACVGIHSNLNSEVNASLEEMVAEHDVVLITPQLLLEHLQDGRMENLCCFTHIFADQCQYVRGLEPYCKLLCRYYMSEKLKQLPNCNLPQITGFTSTLWKGKAKSVQKFQARIMRACALLDAREIVQVDDQPGQNELRLYVSQHTEEQITLHSGYEGHFLGFIITSMTNIARKLRTHSGLFNTMTELLSKEPQQKHSQSYRTWLNDVKVFQSLSEDQDIGQLLHAVYAMLLMYHTALAISVTCLERQAVDFLHGEIDKYSQTQNVYHVEMLDAHNKLMPRGLEQPMDTNANLDILKRQLLEWKQSNPTMKAALACRSVSDAAYIKQWMDTNPELRDLTTALWIGPRLSPYMDIPVKESNQMWKTFAEGSCNLTIMSIITRHSRPVFSVADLVIDYWPTEGKMTVWKKSQLWHVPQSRTDVLVETALRQVRTMTNTQSTFKDSLRHLQLALRAELQ